jgi:chitin deacetylase
MMGQLTRLLLREFFSINSLTIPLMTPRVQTRFDDGPLPPATKLYSFLQENKQAATHFMIGVNILANPDLFVTAFNSGDDLAVHTWSHPWMTAQTNERIVAELGWTMQIIHDSSQGRVPRFWRPPFGDSDERVRAIAKEVFGLTCIIWNHE